MAREYDLTDYHEAIKILSVTNYSQLRMTFKRMNIQTLIKGRKGRFWVSLSCSNYKMYKLFYITY
jgi:hypothetical protein